MDLFDVFFSFLQVSLETLQFIFVSLKPQLSRGQAATLPKEFFGLLPSEFYSLKMEGFGKRTSSFLGPGLGSFRGRDVSFGTGVYVFFGILY